MVADPQRAPVLVGGHTQRQLLSPCGAHAYSVDLLDWHALRAALDGRDADVMVEAKGKEHALKPLGIRIG
jgi:hypothetical protein